MKLFIQIPCLNEAETLARTLDDLPRQIAGVSSIEVLIIDDGSTDETVERAKEWGVRHIVSFGRNQGLARAFQAGLDYCLKQGADIIVNTDADNQYCGADIATLVAGIVSGEFDLVIGDRNVDTIKHFSWPKKVLQRFGSYVVRRLSGTSVPDTTSGFRAYSREAALRLQILSEFSYTLESIIQAGKKRLLIGHVPVRTNPKLRESRLFRSTWHYLKRSSATILRVYALYEPLRTFTLLGAAISIPGVLLVGRFLVYFWAGDGAGKIQSLIVAAVLLIVGFIVFMMGVMADQIGFVRKLLEEQLLRQKRADYQLSKHKD